MFYKKCDTGYTTFGEGAKLKTLLYGKNTQLNEVCVKKGETLKIHQHDYEQTGYLVSGQLKLRIGDDIVVAEPGDGWCVEPNVPHGALLALEDSIAVEVYAPPQVDKKK
ncbi:MAG: cupin domain-containing protein [bacterium]|nr:cupin domain-containing protein [bacterium]